MSNNTKQRPVWIPVVAAIIGENGRILLGQRPERGPLPELWEFPGGKIELGESPEQALKRELQEELGIKAQIGRLMYAKSHQYGEKGVLLLFYQVNEWQNKPQALHHKQLKWVDGETEIHQVPMPEANKQVLEVLRDQLKA